MVRSFVAGIAGTVFLFSVGIADPAFAKKNSGTSGGTSLNGVVYHSDSERSYSGKDYMKGKAVGHSKTIKGKGKAKGHTKKLPLTAQ